MDEQKFENLAKKYPDLFQKAQVEYFECDDGWYGIINVLCGMISRRVDSARQNLQYSVENGTDSLTKWEEKLAKEIDLLPIIAQVKEKFGGLRFYVHGGSEEIRNYIDFAEYMSENVCERCGQPGEPRNDGWVKTLCDFHHKKREHENQ